MTSSNPNLRSTVVLLERAGKQWKAPIWAQASQILGGHSSARVEVNIGRISRLVEEKQVVLVPGKVLGYGIIDKKITIGAYSFSSSARNKIASIGGKVLTVEDLVKEFPDGRGIKLVE
jgi:large subunit ribosomal protein L18e